MKIIIKILAIFYTSLSMSQSTTYHPFPTGNANWIYQYYDDFHMPTSIYTNYSFNGDTLIGSINYKKVYTYSTYSGALREDNKIIYFIPDTTSVEYLLYNFNLNVGDSIVHPYGGAVCTNDTVFVWQIDSVLASDGYHRQFWFDSNAIWIEGIGSLNYLLNPLNVLCVSGNDALLCLSTDSGLNYPSGGLSCVLSTSDYNHNKLNISPNPFSTTTSIEYGLEFIGSKIYIYNTFGQLLREDSVESQLLYHLNRKGLQSGIYFIQLVNKNGGTAFEKVIIN